MAVLQGFCALYPRMFYVDGEDCSAEVALAEVAPSRSTQPSGHQFPNYDCDSFKLEDWKKFKKYLRERAVRFLQFPKLQYVEVQNVLTSDMEHIDYLRRRGDLPQMRVLYDEEKEVMIVKLMPGLAHGVAAMKFHDLFRAMVPSSAGVVAIRSTKFGEVVKRHKEPDQAYLPRRTRLPNPDWPSIVLEVGVSECLRQLHEDARYWLTSGEGRIFTVILISITLNTGEARGKRDGSDGKTNPLLEPLLE